MYLFKLNSANNLSEQQVDLSVEPPNGTSSADSLILAPETFIRLLTYRTVT